MHFHVHAIHAGNADRSQITVFADAAHAFTDPDAGRMERPGIAYHRLADRVSWAGTPDLPSDVLMLHT